METNIFELNGTAIVLNSGQVLHIIEPSRGGGHFKARGALFIGSDMTDDWIFDGQGRFVGDENEPKCPHHVDMKATLAGYEPIISESEVSEPRSTNQEFNMICIAVAPAFAASYGSSNPKLAAQDTVKFARALLDEMLVEEGR